MLNPQALEGFVSWRRCTVSLHGSLGGEQSGTVARMRAVRSQGYTDVHQSLAKILKLVLVEDVAQIMPDLSGYPLLLRMSDLILSQQGGMLTFEMEEDVGLVVLEHLRDKFHVHVLHVDLL